MKNKLSKIEDCFSCYSLDKVNCYERQIANSLEFYHENYGKIYLILNKIRDVYVMPNANFRNINLSNILGIKISHESCEFCSLINKIINKIDMNEIVLLEGDLKYLYYSDYFMHSSWPHLFLIEGYNTEKQLLFIYDNVHLGGLDQMYGHFKLTYNLVHDVSIKNKFCKIININKLKNYDRKNLLVIISNLTDLLIEVINNFDNKIICELETKQIRNNNNLLNVPKYMEVLFNEYSDLVCCIINDCSFKENIRLAEYINIWKKIVNRNILNYFRSKSVNGVLEEDREAINNYEKLILIELNSIKYILANTDFLLPVSNKDNTYTIENDNDHIIKIENKNIYFNFQKNKNYNMWIEDSAPKCLLYQGEINDFILNVDINIDKKYTVEKFQIGIYWEIQNKMYFAAIDNSDLLVLDEIGKNNLSYNKEVLYKHVLLVEYKNKVLSVKIDDDTYTLSRCVLENDINGSKLGVSCKTWGKPGKLDIHCYIKQLEVNKGI